MASALSLSAEKEFRATHRSSSSTFPQEWAPILGANSEADLAQPPAHVLKNVARLYNRTVDKYSSECDNYTKLLTQRKLFDSANRRGEVPTEVAVVLPGFQRDFLLSAPVDDGIAKRYGEYENALEAARAAATDYLHSVYETRLSQSDTTLYRDFSALPIEFAAEALTVITSLKGSKAEDSPRWEEWLSLVEQTLRRKLENLRAEAVNSLGNSHPPALSSPLSVKGKET
ncbi:hypothetical protein PENSPDRAFT_681628 [Peniophora sp. CONT]|nr:hypothetical protein PENSPDRAFT_681628 [Peniophora sp. CONT]